MASTALQSYRAEELHRASTTERPDLRKGCRVELTGLTRENLNGLRGSISGSQRAHWKHGGHKQVCREQFACTICLDDEDYPLPIQCGCGCRDAAGCAHVACKTEYAEHHGAGYHTGWHTCPTCKQRYTGAMELRLAEALRVRLQARPAEDAHRQSAQNLLASAYCQAGRLAEAEALLLDILGTARRVHGPNHSITLSFSANLGRTLLQQRKYSVAEAVFRDTLDRQRIALGHDHEDTLATASSLATALPIQKHAEALSLLRDTLAIQQRVLGDVHILTLETATNLAILLRKTGQHIEAEELGRVALSQAQRTLGPEHPTSLSMAGTLANILGAQGQPTEAVALLTATLAT